jgi:hypothetical protein
MSAGALLLKEVESAMGHDQHSIGAQAIKPSQHL